MTDFPEHACPSVVRHPVNGELGEQVTPVGTCPTCDMGALVAMLGALALMLRALLTMLTALPAILEAMLAVMLGALAFLVII